MAWLVNPSTREREYLAERSVVGRATHCWVHMPHRSVSKEHAVIYFEGDGWKVKDLGSRNGTWANGLRLSPGESVSVGKESSLQFGDVNAVLGSTEPPTLCVRMESTGQCIAAGSGMLSLPDEDEPVATVYEGTPGSWLLDFDGRVQALRDGDTFYIEDQRYIAHVPSAEAHRAFQTTTVRSQPLILLSEVTLRMSVSQDGEATTTTLLHRGDEVEVASRATHQVLLVLAQQRQADSARGIDSKECGWVYADELHKMLGQDSRERVNVDIHRLRQQFAKLGVMDAARLVERRTQTHQLRLGISRVEIG